MPTQEQFYEDFIKKFQGNCAGFVTNVIGAKPTIQQMELLEAFDEDYARISVRSGHGTGKSCTASWLILYLMVCYPFSRTIVTSASLDNLKKTLWAELQKWFYTMIDKPATQIFANWYEITSTQMYHKARNKEWFAVMRTARPENPQAIAGQHADNLLYIVDEASALAPHNELFDVINGALTGGPGNKLLLIGNPTANYGEFYEAFHSKQDSYTSKLHWNGEDSPIVSRRAIDGFKREYGEMSAEYYVRIRGDFAPDPKGMLIARGDIEKVIGVDLVLIDSYHILCCDVAGDGRDSSVIVVMEIMVDHRSNMIEGCKVRKIEEYQAMGDVMHLSNELYMLSGQYRDCPVVVDGIGVGKGVVDRLLERDANVIPFIAGSRADDKRRFINSRAECSHRMKMLVEGKRISLPSGNHKMTDQLSNLPFKYDEKGRLQILSKEKMMDMGLKSPDIADTLIMGMMSIHGAIMDRDQDSRNQEILDNAEKFKNRQTVNPKQQKQGVN